MRSITRLVAVASLCVPVLAGGEDLLITQELLDELNVQLSPLVARELGGEELPVVIRLASKDQVEEELFEENRVLMGNQVENQDAATAMARQFARTLAPALLAKYSFGTGDILVVPDSFDRMAKFLGLPELASVDVLRAVVLHELVHAYDDRRLALGNVLMKLDEPDRIRAMNAVMEGHAQYVARRISKRMGWLPGFESYTAAIGHEPAAEEDPVQALTRKVQSAMLIAYYYQGEKFIAAVEAAGGTEAVERMIQAPPADLAAIYRPQWALDPTSRPKLRYDLKGGLAFAVQEFEDDELWVVTQQTITRTQMLAAMSVLGASVAERALQGLGAARVISCTPKDPSKGQVAVAVLEFLSPQDARAFYDANESALHIKDELMKEGVVRIVAAEYTPVEHERLQGVIARKTLADGPTRIEVVTLIASWESLNIEMNYTGREITDETLIAKSLAMLERCKQAPADEETPRDSDK